METRKSFSINCAKAWSIQLYSDFCFDTDQWHLRRYMKDIRNGIIKEFGIDLPFYTEDTEYDVENGKDEIIYNAIASSGKTITFYDFIAWFNNQYRSMREDAKDLPKLQFPVYKWEKGKNEDASFVFHSFSDGIDGPMIAFSDENEKLNEYVRRHLHIVFAKEKGKYEQSILGYGPAYGWDEPLDAMDQELMKEYMDLALKYRDYLDAYEIFRRTNTEVDKRQFHKKGPLTTAIMGVDPYRDLSQFIVHFGHGGNEPGFYFTYDLGNETLKEPVLNFHEPQADEDVLKDQEDIRKTNPHVLAKTLLLNRDILPFSIK